MFNVIFELKNEIKIEIESDYRKIRVYKNGVEDTILKNVIEYNLKERIIGAYHIKKYGNINLIFAVKDLFGEKEIEKINITGEIEEIPYEKDAIY